MLSRVLLTLACAVVALAAALVIGCTNPELEVATGDPIGVCSVMGPIGPETSLWVGVGLGLFSALALIATWIPAARPAGIRRRAEPVRSLNENLSRLTDDDADQPGIGQVTTSENHLARLTRRLETVEIALGGNGGSREATEQWMGLLRDANDLHNHGNLLTEDFKVINTRLLQVFDPEEDGR